MLFDSENQLVIVKIFKEILKGMNYYNAIRENKTALSTLEPDSYQQFIISADNFSAFYREKNVEDYLAFFHQNYLTD